MTTAKKKNTTTSNYLYRMIGPAHFDEIDAGLKSRRIEHEYVVRESGWRIYRISKTQAERLPKDHGVRYFETRTGSRFSLWDDAALESFRYREGNDWIKVNHGKA